MCKGEAANIALGKQADSQQPGKGQAASWVAKRLYLPHGFCWFRGSRAGHGQFKDPRDHPRNPKDKASGRTVEEEIQ